MSMPTRIKLDTILSGVAGEYYVAAELSRRGFIATITLRNTRGIDILVANKDATRSVGVQVKTNQGRAKQWIVNQKVEEGMASNLFFVFVNLNDGLQPPSFHVVPSQIVSDYARTFHTQWLAGTKPDGGARKDTSMRSFRDPDCQYADRWDLLGM
jgi:hypothetical protein